MASRLLVANLMLLLVAGAASAHAAGQFADQEVDPRFRAKIMKEKAKQNTLSANSFNFNAGEQQSAQCGSQNVGNVDNGGKIGAAPREYSVFAPNASNPVSGQGCK